MGLPAKSLTWSVVFMLTALVVVARILIVYSYSSNIEGIEELSVFLIQKAMLFGSLYSSAEAPCISVPYSPLYFERRDGC